MNLLNKFKHGTSYQPQNDLKIPKDYDIDFLKRSVLKNGHDVNMKELTSDDKCETCLSQCEVECFCFMFCREARIAEAMLKNYHQKEAVMIE